MTFNTANERAYDWNRNLKMKRRRRQCGQICLLATGILLVTLGILIFIFFESFYDSTLKSGLKFAGDSKSFKAWRINDPPLEMEIYVFNWTNPDEIWNESSKPTFREIGPYRFKEIKEKTNLTWDEDGKVIKYFQKKSYFFDHENSVRDLTDVINTISAVPLTVAYKARNSNFWIKKGVSMVLSSVSSLWVTKTSKELLFDGYEDPILSTLTNLPSFLIGTNVQDKFGIFYGKNGTIGVDGNFSMSYSQDETFGRITSWRGRNRTDFYDGHCNDIRGSAGEFYPLNRKKDRLIFYSSELCKYAELEYVKEVEIKGVKGYKYSANNIFDNGTKRPENECFCKGECIPSGVLNVSACRDNSPSFLSFPHFFSADPYYTEAIEGMEPEQEKHEFYIIVEPKSGIVMEIKAGMQVNMLLQPIKYINMYSDAPKKFIPIFYFSQKHELRDELADNLKMIQALPEYANYTTLILELLGLISLSWALCSMFCCSEGLASKKPLQQQHHNAQYEEVPLGEKQ